MKALKPKTKFPTKSQMHTVNVTNGHDLAALTPLKLYIEFKPSYSGCGGSSAKFQVIHIGHETDPKAHWSDYGNKTFDIWNTKDKEGKLAEAIAWTNEKFGQREWVKDPFNSYQDASAIALVWELLERGKK